MIFRPAIAAPMLLVFSLETAFAKDPPQLSLTMEHFRDTATVIEDPAAATATVTTENGFVEHTGPMRMVWHDQFLTGVIDKNGGQKSFQIHAWVIYGGKWRSYEAAIYAASNGPRSVPLIALSRETVNCPVGDCTYTERVAFPVDEQFLRGLAAYAPGNPAMWNFKLTAKYGPDYAGGFSSAEIAGFLARVDQYTSSLPAVKAGAASASLKLDLGISGVPVAATKQHPSRAGILIVAVDEGSVAQKAGVIVGDILYEFDAHPINSLAELQAAVAACAANSTVGAKLFRGVDSIALRVRF